MKGLELEKHIDTEWGKGVSNGVKKTKLTREVGRGFLGCKMFGPINFNFQPRFSCHKLLIEITFAERDKVWAEKCELQYLPKLGDIF